MYSVGPERTLKTLRGKQKSGVSRHLKASIRSVPGPLQLARSLHLPHSSPLVAPVPPQFPHLSVPVPSQELHFYPPPDARPASRVPETATLLVIDVPWKTLAHIQPHTRISSSGFPSYGLYHGRQLMGISTMRLRNARNFPAAANSPMCRISAISVGVWPAMMVREVTVVGEAWPRMRLDSCRWSARALARDHETILRPAPRFRASYTPVDVVPVPADDVVPRG